MLQHGYSHSYDALTWPWHQETNIMRERDFVPSLVRMSDVSVKKVQEQGSSYFDASYGFTEVGLMKLVRDPTIHGTWNMPLAFRAGSMMSVCIAAMVVCVLVPFLKLRTSTVWAVIRIRMHAQISRQSSPSAQLCHFFSVQWSVVHARSHAYSCMTPGTRSSLNPF